MTTELHLRRKWTFRAHGQQVVFIKRYPTIHFAIAKWETNLRITLANVTEALTGLKRHGTLDLLCFEAGSERRWIDERGNLSICFEEITWQRIAAANPV